MARPKKFDVVMITWHDCVEYLEKSWCDGDERLTHEDSLHVTVAFWLEDDGVLTHLCRTYRPANETFEGMLAIPSGCINDVFVLKRRPKN